MTKNQTIVWCLIITAILIYFLNSVVHDKYNYVKEIDYLKSTVSSLKKENKKLIEKGFLLEFEKLEKTHHLNFKKSGNLTSKITAFQEDNRNIKEIIDRYSNVYTRNTQELLKLHALLRTMTKEAEEEAAKREQKKIEEMIQKNKDLKARADALKQQEKSRKEAERIRKEKAEAEKNKVRLVADNVEVEKVK